jgi:hypothetical protein
MEVENCIIPTNVVFNVNGGIVNAALHRALYIAIPELKLYQYLFIICITEF